MNFDDRLRDHLHTQNENLSIDPEGIDGIHARSTRRKQQRAAGFVVACLAVVGVVGAFVFQQTGETTEFATEGPWSVESTTTVPQTDSATSVTVAPDDIESALPEPGVPLALEAIDTTGAPGGYNLYQSGLSGGLYYVLSTAPGVTYEDVVDDDFSVLHPSTFYSFDGSTWSSTTPTDRFVSGVVQSDEVLYAVSTGTKTDTGLSVGRSANAGSDWTWTPIDLTELFGADPEAWPNYNVSQAANGDQRLVVVSTQSWVDTQDAFELARTSSTPIPADAEVVYADQDGLQWFAADANPNDFDSVLAECAAIMNEVTNEMWMDSGLNAGPENLFGDIELTEAEEAELQEWIEANQAFETQVSEEVTRVLQEQDGCTPLAECEATNTALRRELNTAAEALFAEWGLSPFGKLDLTAEQEAALNAMDDANYKKREARLGELGCDAVYAEAYAYEEGYDPENIELATWAELGLTAPDEWAPIRGAFLVDGDVVTSLGNVLSNDYGYIMEVAHRDDAWAITVESGGITADGPASTTYTSPDGIEWSSGPSSGVGYQSDPLADGTTFSISWDENTAAARLIRTNASGDSAAFELGDLAPGLDTDNFQIVDVSTGDFGAAVWAVNWDAVDSSGYQSILLYSPDGIGWGATEVPGMEIVDVVVGTSDVLVFGNDPSRDEGTPQPIFSGTA